MLSHIFTAAQRGFHACALREVLQSAGFVPEIIGLICILKIYQNIFTSLCAFDPFYSFVRQVKCVS